MPGRCPGRAAEMGIGGHGLWKAVSSLQKRPLRRRRTTALRIEPQGRTEFKVMAEEWKPDSDRSYQPQPGVGSHGAKGKFQK